MIAPPDLDRALELVPWLLVLLAVLIAVYLGGRAGSRSRGLRRAGMWVLAAGASFLVESYLAFASAFAAARDFPYGAPIAIGQCHNDFIFSPANICDSSAGAWARYAADIAITAVLFGVIGERWGARAVVSGAVGGLIAVRFAPRDANGAVELLPAWLLAALMSVIAGYLGSRGVSGGRGLVGRIAR